MNLVHALALMLRQAGVRRIFGIPGGGVGLELIEAASQLGVEFVLARDETSAVIMAAVTADLSGSIGVALTSHGPGVSNAINGIACAALDRSPVLVISDGLDDSHLSWVSHQRIDHHALVAPVSKGQLRLDGTEAFLRLGDLIQLARRPPVGPVHIELIASAAAAEVDPVPQATAPNEEIADSNLLDSAREMLAAAKRPVIVAGLEALDQSSSAAMCSLAERLGCPLLTTYKARGAMDSEHPLFVGLFTGGTAEAACVGQADLIILVGLDPVELIPRPWSYSARVIDIGQVAHALHYLEPEFGLHGDIAQTLDRIGQGIRRSRWRGEDITGLRTAMLAHLDTAGDSELNARTVVEIAQQLAPANHRITVDAGAHMVSTMAYCRARLPHDVLISNGLATMAFALPAAIAAALATPDRPVIAFTGDGGLMMCLGELATAVQQACNLIIVVMNDSALSLIDIKQQKKQLQPLGVRWQHVDFVSVINGFGGRGFSATNAGELEQATRAAFEHIAGNPTPALVDVRVDPSGYGRQLEALRSETPRGLK